MAVLVKGRVVKSYEEWVKEVDKWVYALSGLSLYDLPDVSLRDWYEDGMKAASAAKKAIKNAKDE